jgi:hypothetical protein
LVLPLIAAATAIAFGEMGYPPKEYSRTCTGKEKEQSYAKRRPPRQNTIKDFHHKNSLVVQKICAIKIKYQRYCRKPSPRRKDL